MAIVSQNSPRLSGLLEQRELLESRLSTLTQGGEEQLNPRDAAKFQVLTFAERQVQHRDWERQRNKLRTKAAELRANSRNSAGRDRTSTQDSSASSGNGGSASSALSTIGGVKQWLDKRDAQRQSLQRSLSGNSNRLRVLDRQLSKHGLDQEKDELNKLGADKLGKASSMLDSYARMAEGPLRAVKKVDRFWEKRRSDISGAMDKAGPYVDRSQRRLSTETGGSGDLFERMERNRLSALQKRREQRRQQKQDEARNERARHKRNEED
jgi:hypothetical protein